MLKNMNLYLFANACKSKKSNRPSMAPTYTAFFLSFTEWVFLKIESS